ncbi:MAG: F0F1 ATP synthase subunit B [Candidatus Parcubacteria bacterium]|nr:F0F1 ATP synthase subunit B [Candidatus Parcubacteria bacterium]
MESLISTFHLDVKLIIAQLFNFAVVALVLWFFALKPLLKVMSERTKTIEKSLADAKKIEDRLVKTEAEKKQIIDATKKEAANILDETNKKAEANKKEMVEKAKDEIEKLIAKGKYQISSDKEKMLVEVKAELADLVVDATKKVLGESLTKEVDRKVVEEAVKKIR